MTTYTMNGHKHSTTLVQPEILMGIVGNQVAQITRAQWRLRERPAKFSCLKESEPQAQMQAALKQIESLLQQNTQLLRTVFVLNQALNDAHSLIQSDESNTRLDRDRLRLSHDLHGCMDRLRREMQVHSPE